MVQVKLAVILVPSLAAAIAAVIALPYYRPSKLEKKALEYHIPRHRRFRPQVSDSIRDVRMFNEHYLLCH